MSASSPGHARDVDMGGVDEDLPRGPDQVHHPADHPASKQNFHGDKCFRCGEPRHCNNWRSCTRSCMRCKKTSHFGTKCWHAYSEDYDREDTGYSSNTSQQISSFRQPPPWLQAPGILSYPNASPTPERPVEDPARTFSQPELLIPDTPLLPMQLMYGRAQRRSDTESARQCAGAILEGSPSRINAERRYARAPLLRRSLSPRAREAREFEESVERITRDTQRMRVDHAAGRSRRSPSPASLNQRHSSPAPEGRSYRQRSPPRTAEQNLSETTLDRGCTAALEQRVARLRNKILSVRRQDEARRRQSALEYMRGNGTVPPITTAERIYRTGRYREWRPRESRDDV